MLSSLHSGMCTSSDDSGVISSVSTDNWSDIDWKSVNRTVTRFRRRIFAARRAQDWRNLRNLQRLFLKSEANYLSSIRHVTYNSGRFTPGLDDETATTLKDRMALLKKLKNLKSDYDPVPSMRIYVAKPDRRQRPIGIPTIFDSHRVRRTR